MRLRTLWGPGHGHSPYLSSTILFILSGEFNQPFLYYTILEVRAIHPTSPLLFFITTQDHSPNLFSTIIYN